MTIQSNFPAIKPSLNLDFANVENLDSRITFTRASTATYYGTQTAKAEENLLIQSQNFSTSWTLGNLTVTVDTTAAPDGTTTADTLTATASTGAHNLNQNFTFIASQRYVCSVFVKQGTYQYFQIAFGAQGGTFANFDVTTGAGVVGTSAGIVSTSIEDSGNGWYRCVVVFDTINASGVRLNMAASASAAREQSWTAAGTETLFLWGAQLEQRSFVTAYTPTTTQPVTNYIPVLETAASGVARFDHNPTTFESLGLLIEEQRTNLLVYSEQLDNAAWTKTDLSVVANTIVSPDGTLDADKIVENTVSNVFHTASQFIVISGAAGVSYTLSLYAKPAGRNKFILQTDGAFGIGNCTFDVSSGTASAAGGTGSSPKIVAVGNGWYRCSLVVTSSGAFTAVGLKAILVNALDQAQYTGDGYSGIYIWGAQLEAGAFSTSYIPTVASQVTRAADNASMTGTNFSSWYTQGEGTIYIEAAANSSTTTMTALTISDNTSSNRIVLGTGVNNTIWNPFIITGGVGQATLSQSASYPPQTSQKLAVAYKVNDFAATTSGINPTTDNSGILPVVDRVYIGAGATGVAVLNSTIKRFSFYSLRLTNAQLQALTG